MNESRFILFCGLISFVGLLTEWLVLGLFELDRWKRFCLKKDHDRISPAHGVGLCAGQIYYFAVMLYFYQFIYHYDFTCPISYTGHFSLATESLLAAEILVVILDWLLGWIVNLLSRNQIHETGIVKDTHSVVKNGIRGSRANFILYHYFKAYVISVLCLLIWRCYELSQFHYIHNDISLEKRITELTIISLLHLDLVYVITRLCEVCAQQLHDMYFRGVEGCIICYDEEIQAFPYADIFSRNWILNISAAVICGGCWLLHLVLFKLCQVEPFFLFITYLLFFLLFMSRIYINQCNEILVWCV